LKNTREQSAVSWRETLAGQNYVRGETVSGETERCFTVLCTTSHYRDVSDKILSHDEPRQFWTSPPNWQASQLEGIFHFYEDDSLLIYWVVWSPRSRLSFGGTYCIHHQGGNSLWNVHLLLRDYT